MNLPEVHAIIITSQPHRSECRPSKESNGQTTIPVPNVMVGVKIGRSRRYRCSDVSVVFSTTAVVLASSSRSSEVRSVSCWYWPCSCPPVRFTATVGTIVTYVASHRGIKRSWALFWRVFDCRTTARRRRRSRRTFALGTTGILARRFLCVWFRCWGRGCRSVFGILVSSRRLCPSINCFHRLVVPSLGLSC